MPNYGPPKCASCEGKGMGCSEDSPYPLFTLDGEDGPEHYYRCPYLMVKEATWELIRAYSESRSRGYPNGGSFWEQPAVFADVARILDSESAAAQGAKDR